MIQIKLAFRNEQMHNAIQEAYQKLGTACFAALPDTLSVMINDTERNSLAAHKGAFSNAPLYYTTLSGRLHCAFTILELLEPYPGCFTLNYTKIASYLSVRDELGLTDNQTFYKEINRLLPGQSIIEENGSFRLSFYAHKTIDADKYAHLSKEEHIEQWRKSFIGSIKNNLQSGKKTAAHLSGGLDSSSVCSLAQSLSNDRLAALHVYTATEESEELNYAKAVSKKWAMDFKIVKPPDESIESVLRITKTTGLPHTYNLPPSFLLSILDTGTMLATETLLSGFLGDQVIDYGDGYYEELAQSQNWEKLAELVQKKHHSPVKTRRSIINFLLRRIRKKPQIRTVIALYKTAIETLEYSPFTICKDIVFLLREHNRYQQKNDTDNQEIVTSFTKRRVFENDNLLKLSPLSLVKGTLNADQQTIIDSLYQNLAVEAIEYQYLLFAASGIEVAYPFFDRELVEVSFHSKNEWKYGNGEFRATLRAAMQPYLPEEVVNRTTKAAFNTYVQHQFSLLYKAFIAHCNGHYANHSVWKLVNKKVFERIAAHILSPKANHLTVHYTFIANRVIYLALWLNYQQEAKWLASTHRSEQKIK